MTIKTFTDKLLKEFDEELTDQVFLYIQSNREIMHDYLLTVSHYEEVKIVNSKIAQAIKQHYVLTTKNQINNNPKSNLIQSYEKFEK